MTGPQAPTFSATILSLGRSQAAIRRSAAHREATPVTSMTAAAQRAHASYYIPVRATVVPLAVQRALNTHVLQGRIRADWVLIKPLLLTEQLDEYGDVLLSDETFNLYGVGPTKVRALHDYVESLIEYYELVAAGAQHNPHDAAMLADLGQYLLKTTA